MLPSIEKSTLYGFLLFFSVFAKPILADEDSTSNFTENNFTENNFTESNFTESNFTESNFTESNTSHIEQVVVTGHAYEMLNGTGDTADVLSNQGVDFSSAGGISSLPVLRGLNDDRIKLIVDGAETTSACANHMNPALSYIDSSRVNSVDVMAGITPVSMGGDSIGGTIKILSETPVYADSEGKVLKTGSAGFFYRSNNNNHGVVLKLGVASETKSLLYTGSMDKADSYEDGGGNTVLDTLYKSESHSLTLGLRGEKQAMTLKLNHQKVPYQGFPNQYMDMVGNSSTGLNFNYLRQFDWGQLDTLLTWQNVDHEMGFFTKEKPGTMPMITEGRDLAYKIAAEIPYGKDSTLRLGNELHQFTLNDWWPAVEGSMMMGPNDYININNGERTRHVLYAEAEQSLAKNWRAILGVRYEHVVMNAENVQAYNAMPGMMNMDASAANAFNSRDHKRNDDNVDITAVGRYTPAGAYSIEFGYAQKTRSPNLYERYSWGRGTMAMTMIGWFGDGNGYVGDVDLAPEIAHTLSATFNWGENESSQLSFTPYYTYVDNYIDARQIGSFHPRMAMAVTRPLLQFVNIDAKLYGAELHGRKSLFESRNAPTILDLRIAYTKGERADNGGDLYHIMPLNVKLALEQNLQQWRNRIEVEWIKGKDNVDDLRLEPATKSYTLVNISTAYQWKKVLLSAGVRNLFDEQYDLPLGGVYYSGWLAGDKSGQFESLPGQGRSLDIGMKYEF